MSAEIQMSKLQATTTSTITCTSPWVDVVVRVLVVGCGALVTVRCAQGRSGRAKSNSLDLRYGCAKMLSLRRIQKLESGSHKTK
jgi:hypothetical protein